jgi:hypothetical protein
MRLLVRLGIAGCLWCAIWVADSYLPGAPRLSLWLTLAPAIAIALLLHVLAISFIWVAVKSQQASSPSMMRGIAERLSPGVRGLTVVAAVLFWLAAGHGMFVASTQRAYAGGVGFFLVLTSAALPYLCAARARAFSNS